MDIYSHMYVLDTTIEEKLLRWERWLKVECLDKKAGKDGCWGKDAQYKTFACKKILKINLIKINLTNLF